MGYAVLLFILSVLAAVLRKCWESWRAVLLIRNHPGSRTIFPLLGSSLMFPPVPYVWEGAAAHRDKYKEFSRHGIDILSAVSTLPSPRIHFSIVDPGVIKEILASRDRFPKAVDLYKPLAIFGENILASENDAWKKYRKVSTPAFSEKNARVVWDETVKVVDDLFQDVWGGQKEIVLNNATEITKQITLFVIGAAGFGHRPEWVDQLKVPPGHSMTFKDALVTAATDGFFKILFPTWAMPLFSFSRRVDAALKDLEKYMSEIVENRKLPSECHVVGGDDLVSRLLGENEDNKKVVLTQEELLGNVFAFLIAGHETTAHTLSFALALLALYQDEQGCAYQEVIATIPEDRPPAYQDLPSFDYIGCVLYETLRMFPPAPWIPKVSAEDTTLYTINNSGESVPIAIPKGAGININAAGLHYHPKYWEDPETFKPSRFQGDWPREAFLPFSSGAHSCLGRRFAELEVIVAIAMIVKRYKITVNEESRFEGETFKQRKERVLRARIGLTLTPVRTPLVFTLRE